MSQEYTPVDWVDETTSQQGTLINAERLNQMQTAHHYADGFEEVDAIPTEDPGVDYHKVVYCTADATFYRWDGEVWTADIDESTKHLLDQEIARAEHAEGLIQGYLDAHEANHNNPHQVTKAQVGLGNCDNTADLDKPISTAVQAALDTKADKASTLAGYGITDAYNKTEADNLLAAKADATALTDGSVTKVGTADVGTDTKPIKLVGGVPTAVGHDLVTTDTAQNITANKNYVSNFLRVKDLNQPAYDTPTSNRQSIMIQAVGNDDVWGYRAEFWKNASGSALLQNRLRTPGGECEIRQTVESDGTAHARVIGQRAYNAANTSDIATIGTLDAYSPMVRTSGNQDISGNKVFTNSISNKVPAFNRESPPNTRSYRDGIMITDGSNNEMGALSLVYLTNGDRAINLVLYDKNGNRKEKTVFQIDQDGNVIL